MISPKCDKCSEPLMDFGGLAFSPPDANNRVVKYHFCVNCFALLQEWLAQPLEAPSKASKGAKPKPRGRT